MSRDGDVLYDVYGDVQRELVTNLSLVPDYLKKATVAVEDKNFYTHQGFDITYLVGQWLTLFFTITPRRINLNSTIGQKRPSDTGKIPAEKTKRVCFIGSIGKKIYQGSNFADVSAGIPLRRTGGRSRDCSLGLFW